MSLPNIQLQDPKSWVFLTYVQVYLFLALSDLVSFLNGFGKFKLKYNFNTYRL